MGMGSMDLRSLLTQDGSTAAASPPQSPSPRLTQRPGVGARSGALLGCPHSQASLWGREARPSSLPNASGEGEGGGKGRLSRKPGWLVCRHARTPGPRAQEASDKSAR